MYKRFLLVIGLSIIAVISACAQEEAEESNLKAAFLYNFTKYIDWNNTDSSDVFAIGVLGSSAIYAPLEEIAQTKMANNKRIVVRHFNNPSEITFCNILFISARSPFSLSSILDKTGKGTLTVAEEPGFAQKGVAFNFVLINDKLKFEANMKSIADAGLKASSQLLKLAKIVDNP